MDKLRRTIKVRLILEQEGQILMLQQTDNNGGKFTLIGGVVETREFPLEALIRETKEEAGITLFKENLQLAHTLFKQKQNSLRIVMYFKATTWAGKIMSMEPKKFKHVSWHSLDRLPKETSPTVRHVMKQYLRNNLYSSLRR